MNVLLITTDLLAASQFTGAVQACGAKLVTATPKKAIDKAVELSPRVVALELASPLGDVAALVADLKQHTPTVIAFGPHVQEARLQAAADAGCDLVLTRGQFHRQAAEILARYVSAPESAVADKSDDETGDGASPS